MIYVLDANIFAKLFVDEEDSEQAKVLIAHCTQDDIPLLMPSLFLYEVLEVVRRSPFSLQTAWESLQSFSDQDNVHLLEPEKRHIDIAERMCLAGHEKSGFPSFYDSIYHAFAIAEHGTFITADKRHYRKTEHEGHIVLLSDFHA